MKGVGEVVKDDTSKTIKVDRKSDIGGFSAKEIRMVVKFIDNSGEGEGAGDGSITMDELEKAFRRGRRSRANAAQDSRGQLLVRRFEKLLRDSMTTVEAWFSGIDQNAAGNSNGILQGYEIKEGIRTLAAEIGGKQLTFSEEELEAVIRYMDNSGGDSALTIEEFKDGMKRAKQTPKAIRDAQKAGAIMCRMTDFMDKHKMTIKNLFQFIDKDRSNHITLDELREGLKEMATSGAEKFAKKKEGLVAARKKKEEEKKFKFDAEVKGRLLKLSESGAIKVLDGLDLYMKKEDQRIVDLFGRSQFDKSGDGCLGKKEFFKLLQVVGIKCTRAECKALINVIDDSGDGEIEAYELEKILRRYRIDNIYIREQQRAMKKELRKIMKANKKNKAPEIEETENEFVKMMKEQAGRRTTLLRDLKKKEDEEKEKIKKEKEKRRDSLHKLPAIPKMKRNTKVASGSVLDGTWLHSFDKSLRAHVRQLEK